MKIVGIILILIGVGLTAFTAVTFFTKQKVADIGNIEISKEKPHSIYWSPIVGVAVIAVGGIVFWQGSKK